MIAITVKAIKLVTKIPWNSLASASERPDMLPDRLFSAMCFTSGWGPCGPSHPGTPRGRIPRGFPRESRTIRPSHEGEWNTVVRRAARGGEQRALVAAPVPGHRPLEQRGNEKHRKRRRQQQLELQFFFLALVDHRHTHALPWLLDARQLADGLQDIRILDTRGRRVARHAFSAIAQPLGGR